MIFGLALVTHTPLDDVRPFLSGNPTETALLPDRTEACAHLGRILRWFSN